MPSHTIDISAEVENRLLARHVAPYNTAFKASFTLDEWVLVHLKELAVQDELSNAVSQLQAQEQTNANNALQAAVEAERQRLIATLG